MPFTSRPLVDEHLVRKDENGYSMDHCLVSDISRSLIQEMEETVELLNRIRRLKQLNRTKEYETHVDDITAEDIEILLRYKINKKDMNNKNNTETRKLIDYKDIDIF